MTAFRVGITGGLASGKSTVARWLAEAGFEVHDADRLVAELYQPGRAGAAAVEHLFGPGVLNEEGGVDHARVATRVFGDPAARRALEEAIHPLVRERYAEIAALAKGVVVFEATLMVESGSSSDLDLVVTVEADPALRLRRAIARGMSEEAARARLAAQGDGARRRAGAQRVIHNDGDLAALRRQVDELIGLLRARVVPAVASSRASSFVLVSGNRGKIAEARRLAGARLEAVELDLPEIQQLDLFTILRAKAEEAWRRLGRPLVVEEAGLELAALGGFPGPLVKWMLEATGAEGLARVALALGEPRAVARCGLLYRDAAGTVEAEGSSAGVLVLPGRGCQGFGWDPVFQPEGESRTFGELGGAEKDRLSHRGHAWRSLLSRLGRHREPPTPGAGTARG